MKTIVYLALTLMTYGSHLWSMDNVRKDGAYAFERQFQAMTFIDIGMHDPEKTKVGIKVKCGDNFFTVQPECEIFYQHENNTIKKLLISLDQKSVFQAIKKSREFRDIQLNSDDQVRCDAISLDVMATDQNDDEKKYSYALDDADKQCPLSLSIDESGSIKEIIFEGTLPRLAGTWFSPCLFFSLSSMTADPKIKFTVAAPNSTGIDMCTTIKSYYVSLKAANSCIITLGDINSSIKTSADINDYIDKFDCFPKGWTLKEINCNTKSHILNETKYVY